MALWAGRFSKEIDAGVNAFNSSIAFDARMYRHDIQGSIAHATMLGDCGIISKEDSKTIIEGLPFWQIWTAASWNLIPMQRTFTCSWRQS